MQLSPGDRVGQYEVLETLGQGGMGTVYRARHLGLDRVTALKVLRSDLAENEEFVARFSQEARLAAQLRHPNIAAVYDFGEAAGQLYIAMEYSEGVALGTLLTAALPLDLTASILTQMCAALSAAHAAGVVHRDLKPNNIILEPSGHAMLTDFGIAKSLRSAGVTASGSLLGTPEYISPEQAAGKSVDHRADIYALGIILYEACTGAPPFRDESQVATAAKHIHESVPRVADLVPDIPPWVDDVIQRCCAKDPEARYATATEVAEALSVAGATPVPVPPDIMERVGAPSYASTLTAILRGEVTPEELSHISPEWERAAREALEREVTVASLDVVGSRRMKADGSTLLLSFLFERFRRFIDTTCDLRGCLAHTWSGDGLTAVFTDAGAAVDAMREVVGRLGEFETPDPGRSFRVRVGIHRGRVIMPSRSDLGRVTSRVFDTAGHLQKSCPPDEIWATEEVVQAAGLAGEFEPLGRVEDAYVYFWRPDLEAVVHPPGSTPTPTPVVRPTPTRRPSTGPHPLAASGPRHDAHPRGRRVALGVAIAAVALTPRRRQGHALPRLQGMNRSGPARPSRGQSPGA